MVEARRQRESEKVVDGMVLLFGYTVGSQLIYILWTCQRPPRALPSCITLHINIHAIQRKHIYFILFSAFFMVVIYILQIHMLNFRVMVVEVQLKNE